MTQYNDPASATAQAQTDQVEGWLARHRELGTPRTQWSPVEDARQADHAEAHVIDAKLEAEKVLTLNSQAGKVDTVNNTAETQTATVTRETTGSAVVQLLEKVWSRIRENHPELPAVVIVTGAGLTFGGGKWGHFRANGWTTANSEHQETINRIETADVSRMHEMFMAGETLAKGARQVLQTMLHEGAHTLARVRDIQDTSRQGRWHNAKFRTLAEEMGLEHKNATADSSIGFSFVSLTDETVAEYADLLEELDREIHLMVQLPGFLKGIDGEQGGEGMGKAPKGPAAPNTNNVKATCLCEEPNIIRLSRKVLDKRVVQCDDCDSLFMDRG